MIAVANKTPQANEIAIGTTKNVAGFADIINGTRPINVVNEVRNIGRKRCAPAVDTAAYP